MALSLSPQRGPMLHLDVDLDPLPLAFRPPDDRLSPRDAAELIGVSATTLKRWRNEGRGPAFIRQTHCCVRYRRSALLAWRAANPRPAC